MTVAINLLDLANEGVASAPGTSSTISLSGTAVQGPFLTWANAGVVDQVVYRVHILDGNNREICYATYNTTGNKFTNRTTIIASVNGTKQTTAINATSQAQIGVVATAEDLVTSTNALGEINKFRNPGMDVAQRGTSGSVSSGTTAYSLDGWQIVTTGAAAAWSQQYNSHLSGNALRINCATGLTACTVKQRIESFVASQLLGTGKTAQPITVQFAIYNNSGASITPQIAAGFASAQDNFGTVTSDLAATNLQSIANATVGVVAYTFTPSASLANGYEVQLEFGGGLNAASGAVDISLADIRVASLPATTGQNNSPPPPELRPIAKEMVNCQRYFTTTYGNGNATGTATANGIVGVSSTDADVPFPVEMRAAPTLSYWDSAGNASKVSTMVTQNPSLVSLGNSAPASGSSGTLVPSANIQAGDLVVVGISLFNNSLATVSSVSDGTNTYTKAIQKTGGTQFSTEIWYKENAAAVSSPTITVTYSGNNTQGVIVAARLPGMVTSGSLDKTNSGTATPLTTGTLTQANEFVFGMNSTNGNTNGSTDATFTQLGENAQGTGMQGDMDYKSVTSTTSVSWSPTGATMDSLVLATFKEQSLGGFNANNSAGATFALDTGTTGFISGAGLGSLVGQGAYFHYSASAEL